MNFKVISLTAIVFFIITNLYSFETENSEANRSKTKQIFNKIVKAIGNVDSIRNVQTKGKTWQPIEQGSMTFETNVTAIFPDKFKVKFLDQEFIISENKGWRKYPKGYFENLPSSLIPEIMGNLKRNLINLLKFQNEYEIIFLKEKEVDGKSYDILQVNNDEIQFKLIIDKETNLPFQMIYESDEYEKPISIYRMIKEYKDFNGIKFPIHTISYDESGNKISEIKISEVKFNVEIDEDEF
ncbi:MAG TPA: hypothetical protein ENL20_03650 [Candidatus Cloacimonetes bacterium]|nr:hypothetical protein [Candidatus Cloacimonadota bacterium]